ncbi:MAG: glutamine synthetase adenylyltransferase, partial [Chloroflexota bacterium]
MDDQGFGLLLEDEIDAGQAHRLLESIGFADTQAAWVCIKRLASKSDIKDTLANLLPHLFLTLSGAASPDRALVSFERFVNRSSASSDIFRDLAGNPRTVEILVSLFSASRFLTEILLNNPETYKQLAEHKRLAQPKDASQLDEEIRATIAAFDQADEKLDALRRFQRLELLRIGACDLLDLFDLTAATAQLSNLADSLVRACLEIASARAHISTSGFGIIAMGKLGGKELNY